MPVTSLKCHVRNTGIFILIISFNKEVYLSLVKFSLVMSSESQCKLDHLVQFV